MSGSTKQDPRHVRYLNERANHPYIRNELLFLDWSHEKTRALMLKFANELTKNRRTVPMRQEIIIEQILPQVDELYEAAVKECKIVNLSISQAGSDVIKRGVVNHYRKRKADLVCIKEEMLSDNSGNLYDLSNFGQERRDFTGRLLKKILQHFGENEFDIGEQKLAPLAASIRKHTD